MRIRISLLGALLLGWTLVFAQSGVLEGKVTDGKTGEGLIGATVVLDGTEWGSVTDLEGNFVIKNIPPKTYNVTASYVGYQNLTQFNVVIRSEGNIALNFALKEAVSELEEIVVIANPFTKLEETPLSIQKLSAEEVAAYPGGNNDIAKVVQSLPGVSGSVGGFRNDVIIRGGAPNENVYYLDGVEIPNINHFSTQGSAGGPVGLLNVSFFEGVTLTTSSFGAVYDNVLSGVLQFDQRNGNAKEFRGNIRVGASETALTLEGPLFKGEEEEAKTTFIASGRRSYLQFLFDVIGLPFLPDYWDYQYKVNHKVDDFNDILVTGVGSIDDFAVNELDEYTPEQQAIQDQVPVIRQRTNSGGISWRRRFKDKSGFMNTTLSTNLLKNTFFRYQDNINEQGLLFQNDSQEQETKLRFNVTKFLTDWTIAYGLSVQNADYSNVTDDVINNFTYSNSLNFFRYGMFFQSSRKFNNERLGFSFGIRTDGNNFTNTGNELYRTLSPRGALSYQLTENGKWTANISAGRYYKIPPYTILGFQDNAGVNINANTEYIQNDHLVGGFEYLLNKFSRISAEGFLKTYNNYPVSVLDGVSLANKGAGFEVLGNEPVISDGKGRTYGLELLYQQKFNGRYYAIVAYTLYKSEFTGADQAIYRPSTWDNGQLVSLTGGYKFGNNWEISSRYRYAGSAPYAPTDLNATLANYPVVIKDFSNLGDVELDPFSQLDVRIDKKFNFKKWSLDLFLDIQNILAQPLPGEPSYGLDRDDEGIIIEPRSLILVEPAETGSILPSLGVVVNF